MSQELWSAVDCYIGGLLAPHDALLSDALEASAAAGLPAIQVSPTQGKLLHVLARMVGARNILEIGTLGGYSTIWMARALPPGGYLLTLEADKKHAQVARTNFDHAGLGTTIALRFGPALETLPDGRQQRLRRVRVGARHRRSKMTREKLQARAPRASVP